MPSVNENSNLADRLWKVRTKRGLSYRQAAKQIGVTVSMVHDIEKNVSDPRWSTVQKILRWMSREP